MRCEFFPDGRNITYVDHLNEEGTKVDGYEGPGEFKQEIHYKDTTLEMMEALINRYVDISIPYSHYISFFILNLPISTILKSLLDVLGSYDSTCHF